jgi:hypothetical protein
VRAAKQHCNACTAPATVSREDLSAGFHTSWQPLRFTWEGEMIALMYQHFVSPETGLK